MERQKEVKKEKGKEIEEMFWSNAHQHDPQTWALHRLCKIVKQAALSIGSADSLALAGGRSHDA